MDLTQIYKIDNFLEPKELENFNIISNEHYSWRLLNTSYDDSRLFWYKELWLTKNVEERSDVIETTFREKIEFFLKIKVETQELYMNGQTHSQSGKMHSDEKDSWDPSSDYITLVYYANKEWNPEWGGFTIIDDGGGNTHIIYPKPNSVVVFNSRLKHVALEPTIHCPSMRTTVAHKMKIIKD